MSDTESCSSPPAREKHRDPGSITSSSNAAAVSELDIEEHSTAVPARGPSRPVPTPPAHKPRWKMALWLLVPAVTGLIWLVTTHAHAHPGPSAPMFWTQFFFVLAAILMGVRRGGVALGLIGGLGIAVLVLGFRMPPSEPPIAVMLIILAVVTASATLQWLAVSISLCN
jgi:hypothetical protein